MKWIRYDGPAEHASTLTISDTLILGLGSAAPVDDDTVDLLLASPNIYGVVTVIDGPTPAPVSWPSGHAALDTLAEKFGVTYPPPAEGKQKLTVDEKVAALEAAGFKPDSEPDTTTKE